MAALERLQLDQLAAARAASAADLPLKRTLPPERTARGDTLSETGARTATASGFAHS